MHFLRNLGFTAALLLAGAAHATDVSMAGGSISFTTPDSWPVIMQTEGDPEVRVFQVPDPSPTGSNALARITVTAKQVDSIDSFQLYVSAAATKAAALTGYHPGNSLSSSKGMDSAVYSAQENGVQFVYSESYWFKNGHAIQLRCVRPATSQAGAAWQAQFDKGCLAIATKLGA
jgi:hypothetical protein